LKLIGLPLDERPEPVKKSFERLHPKKSESWCFKFFQKG
jgi:hypothetical protein